MTALGAERVYALLGKRLELEESPVITAIEPLKVLERPRSLLLHCRLHMEGGEESLVWVKFLAPSDPPNIKQTRIARDFDLGAHLFHALGADGPFLVPRPLYHSPEDRVIVTAHCPGRVLQDHIASGARGLLHSGDLRLLEHECELAGRWLRAFQRATAGFCPGSVRGRGPERIKTVARIVEQTLERLEQLVGSNPDVFTSHERAALVAFLNDNLVEAGVENPEICSVHGDFFAGNLMLDGERVIGLDFESATCGCPWFDPSYFVFQLDTFREKLWYRDSAIDRLSAAFLSGYGIEDDPHGIWRIRPAFRILFVAHAVSRLVSLAIPGRATSAKSLYRRMLGRRLLGQLGSHVGRY